jgi:CAAX prenyl protease-like protein
VAHFSGSSCSDTPRPAAASMNSILFGVWHVLPTLHTLRLNPAAASVRRDPMRMGGAILAAVASTALAGYGLAWLRFRSGSLAAPAVVHASLNAIAYLAARSVVDTASDSPAQRRHQEPVADHTTDRLDLRRGDQSALQQPALRQPGRTGRVGWRPGTFLRCAALPTSACSKQPGSASA